MRMLCTRDCNAFTPCTHRRIRCLADVITIKEKKRAISTVAVAGVITDKSMKAAVFN